MIWAKRALFALTGIVIWVALTVLFISKERLCNAAIEAASKAQVGICYDERTASPIGCDMQRMTLLYTHSAVAKVRNVRISLLEIRLSSIHLEGIAASLLPANIYTATIRLLPGTIKAKGDFGTLKGEISWRTRSVRLVLSPSPLMRKNFTSTLRYFNLRNGKYIYVASF
ncbi:hypothetical protein [Hydrogenimonas sp.]